MVTINLQQTIKNPLPLSSIFPDETYTVLSFLKRPPSDQVKLDKFKTYKRFEISAWVPLSLYSFTTSYVSIFNMFPINTKLTFANHI